MVRDEWTQSNYGNADSSLSLKKNYITLIKTISLIFFHAKGLKTIS